MHRMDGHLILSATDLVNFLACEHVTQLDGQVALGLLDKPRRDDPSLEMLGRKGRVHEASVLARLGVDRSCVEIEVDGSSVPGLLAAEAETLAAMRAGTDIIYQATFFDGRWRGHADFLLRVCSPSALGAWSYEVADAKLARSVKRGVITQLTEYSLQLGRLQGVEPASMHVGLGDGSWAILPVADGMAAHRVDRARLERTALGPPLTTYGDPVDHCGICRWADVCAEARRADDHLSLLPGMRSGHTRMLVDIGITTVAALAAAPAPPPVDITEAVLDRHRCHARLQVLEHATGRPAYELLPGIDGGGLSLLPPPSPADLFFDMESEPFGIEGGLEYLFGIIEVAGGEPDYLAFWAHTRADEKAAFESLVDLVVARLQRHPDLHVFHYASYEVAALRRLAARHATRQAEVERLIGAAVLVDLYRVVRESVCISRSSYSLKSLEDFYMPRRDDAVSNAGGSMVAYDQWRRTGDAALLEAIRIYNERDCLSTLHLRNWLEERRREVGPPVVTADRR